MRDYRSGFVGIIGPTNAGKSTLLNALMGRKLAIVSPRAQTTYQPIRGIQTSPSAQIVYSDAPGYQKFPDRIPKILNQIADREADSADILIWVFDVSQKQWRQRLDELSPKIKKLAATKRSIGVLNKIDRIRKPDLLPILESLHQEPPLFHEIVPVSALKKDGIDRLSQIIEPYLPQGQPLYSQDLLTDRNEQFIVRERVREQIYLATREELPYTVRVEVTQWAPGPKCPVIGCVIYVDSVARRKILIGKRGEMLKKIGMGARIDVEKYLGQKICLKLDIQVDKNWRENKATVRQYLES